MFLSTPIKRQLHAKKLSPENWCVNVWPLLLTLPNGNGEGGVTYVPVNLNSGPADTFHKSYAFYLRGEPPDDAVMTLSLSSKFPTPVLRT